MKPVPNFPGYFATKDGRIYSGPNKNWLMGRFLILRKPNEWGHIKVCLCKHGKQYCRFVHRLILETFVGPCPEGMECCHSNGDPGDNRLENLRWDTHSNNTFDSIRHGTYVDNRGEKSGRAKLTEVQIREIRQLLESGVLTQRKIATMFQISAVMVGKIRTRQNWSHVI